MAAEAASYELKNAVLCLPDVTELILAGAFHGIHEFYSMGNGELKKGLLSYLRSAIFATDAATRRTVDDKFDRLRDRSLFVAGLTALKFYFNL